MYWLLFLAIFMEYRYTHFYVYKLNVISVILILHLYFCLNLRGQDSCPCKTFYTLFFAIIWSFFTIAQESRDM